MTLFTPLNAGELAQIQGGGFSIVFTDLIAKPPPPQPYLQLNLLFTNVLGGFSVAR